MTFKELEPVIKRAFPEENNLHIEMTKNDILSWDSIGHLNLIVEVEDEFGISFSKDEIESINSVEKLLELINSKLV